MLFPIVFRPDIAVFKSQTCLDFTLWEVPCMKIVHADDRKRVRIPDAKPGQAFAYKISGETVILQALKRIEPAAITGRIIRRGKRLVGVTDGPIDMDALNRALAEFP